MNDASRKIAVVTGAGSGIGAAIARELSARGFTVVATDIDHAAAARVAGEKDFHGEALHLDVREPASSQAVAEHVARKYGRLDVWVSNAGVSHMQPFLEVSPEDLERTLAVNLKGPYFCGQAAARTMIELGRPGKIIHTESMAAKAGGVEFLSDYVASKFGVRGLTKSMARELAPYGITVNGVCPGFVATAMQDDEVALEARLRGITEEQVREMYVADTPLGRMQQPEDVARVVAFLAGPDSDFMTGVSVDVNGGARMD